MFAKPSSRFLLFALIAVVPLLASLGASLSVPVFSEWLASRRSSLLLATCLGWFWFLGGTLFAAQFLFPVRTWCARLNAWWCFLVWYIGRHRPGYVVQNGKVEDRLKGNRFGGWAGIVLVDSSSAAVMDDGLQYTRIVGPYASQHCWFSRQARSSTFFLKKYEQVCGVVDLRRHRAVRHVRAITRDGLEVSNDLIIDFQIRRVEQLPDPKIPYTFDEKAVFRAVYSEAVRKEQTETPIPESQPQAPSHSKCEYRWTDAVINEGTEELRNLVARYSLDQLYAIEDPDREPRIEIEQRLLTLLQERMASRGVDVLNVTLGVFDVLTPVVSQRIETWKAEWERRQKITLAQGESEQKRRMEIARALAQLEMIENITRALPDNDDALSKDIVTLRLIQAVEAMAQSSSAHADASSTQARASELLRRVLADLT